MGRCSEEKPWGCGGAGIEAAGKLGGTLCKSWTGCRVGEGQMDKLPPSSPNPQRLLKGGRLMGEGTLVLRKLL